MNNTNFPQGTIAELPASKHGSLVDFASAEYGDVLRLSTDVQSGLIRELSDPRLSDMLDNILVQVQSALKADACAIFIDDYSDSPIGERTATMRAAQGYQRNDVGLAKCHVLAAEDVPSQPMPSQELGLTGWVISTGKSFLARSPQDLYNHPHWSGKHDSQQMPSVAKPLELAAFLAVPLRDPRGRVVGALKAERLAPGEPFSVQNQITLEALARVAGRCITYVEDAQKGQVNAAIVSWTLDVISEAVATGGELDAFLDIVVRGIAAATQADSCAVFLIDESNKTLTQRAGSGSQVLRRVIRSYKLPDQAKLVDCSQTTACSPTTCRYKADLPREKRVGLTAWVATTGKSFSARNFEELKEHCHHLGRFDEPNYEGEQKCGAWLGVPLLVGGQIIGVLKIENISYEGTPDERYFDAKIQQQLDVLASDIALSIRRFQIQSPLRYQVIQNAMPTILAILQGGLDVSSLVKKVVEETAKLFNARACSLFLKEGNQLIQPPWAAVGYTSQSTEEGAMIRRYNLVKPEQILDIPTPEFPKVGLTVWIAVKEQKFTAKSNLELTSHPHHKGEFDSVNFAEGDRCEALMGIPLLLGKELVGVLKVETKQRQVGSDTEYAYFNEQDELVFALIANSAAIAIQNARLLESRRLAELLVDLPDANRVMSELHQFIRGREEVVSTLESTAEAVRARDPSKATIIQNFAALLKPDFHVTILEQLMGQITDPLAGLLGLIVSAMQVEHLDQIRDLPARKLLVAALQNTAFYKCAEILLETWRQINDHLEGYRDDPTLRSDLQESLHHLTISENRVEKMDLFERNVLGFVFARWHAVIQEESNQFHPVPNPYVAGLPVQADQPVFVGRDEIFRWIQDTLVGHAQKNVLVLHGGWHTGKTSILKQLLAGPFGRQLRERRQYPVIPVYIDLQAMPDKGTDFLLLRIAEHIESTLRQRNVPVPTVEEDRFKSAHFRAFDKFIEEVDRLLLERDRSILAIMIDEFELLDQYVKEKRVDAAIFSYLRSVMQHRSSVGFILAGRHRLDEMTTTYRNLIFNVAQHQEVGFLDRSESERLIRDPVKQSAVTYDDQVVEKILALTGGHPYFIQQLCFNCIDHLNQRKRGYQVTQELLNRAIEDALTHNALLDNLWEKEIAPNDQYVLTALAGLSDGETWVTALDLALRAGLEPEDVLRSLEKLETSRLIRYKQSLQGTDTMVQYRIDLLRLWVNRASI